MSAVCPYCNARVEPSALRCPSCKGSLPVASRPPAPPPSEDPHLATRRITRLSVGAALTLIALKAFALGASGSVSILASLTDSVLDLAASLATFFAVRWAAAPPDEDHRYGHGKGEALAALQVWLGDLSDTCDRPATPCR
jgi:hypothetical protein